MVLCAGPGEAYGQLEAVAEVVIVQQDGSPSVDLEAGLVALKQHGVQSVLCEGGPRLAARLVAAGLVDRLEWLIAPVALSTSRAVAALGPLAGPVRWTVDATQRLGADARISARPARPAHL